MIPKFDVRPKVLSRISTLTEGLSLEKELSKRAVVYLAMIQSDRADLAIDENKAVVYLAIDEKKKSTIIL